MSDNKRCPECGGLVWVTGFYTRQRVMQEYKPQPAGGFEAQAPHRFALIVNCNHCDARLPWDVEELMGARKKRRKAA